MLCDFHPVALCFKVSMHWRRLIARISPETDGPAEQADSHEYEGYGDPLRHGAFCRPQERDEGKGWFR